MSSRNLLRVGWVLLLASCANFQRCQPISCTLESFVYAPHKVPRVFVFHRPIHPLVGETVEIFVEPELVEGRTVLSAFVTFTAPEGAASDTQQCEAMPAGQWKCAFTAPDSPVLATYSGGVLDDDSDYIYSATSYRFQVGQPAADVDALFPVRVPVKRFEKLTDDFRLEVALVRDPSRVPGVPEYGLQQFEQDLERALYQQFFLDPAYRWRDNQLGFYVYTRPGSTRPHSVGLDTRCGQNPWPNELQYPNALGEMEVVGVMHRRGSAFGALEGEAKPEDDADEGDQSFRDCAGSALRNPDVRTFSAHGGKPAVWQHELGHAAFGLGDEYWESEATRRVSPQPSGVLGTDTSCCCLQTGDPVFDSGESSGEGGFGLDGGAAAGIYCIQQPGGTLTFLCGVESASGFPPVVNPCSPVVLSTTPRLCGGGDGPPAHCGESPISVADCPPLRGTCTLRSAWLGEEPSELLALQRPNVFVSIEECQESVAAAGDHPGVEVGDTGLGKCVQLCGMEGKPCPCGDVDLWIADRNPGDPSFGDIMSTHLATLNLQGGTCDWCVETSLCVRWQRALDKSEEDTWAWCQDPPAWAP